MTIEFPFASFIVVKRLLLRSTLFVLRLCAIWSALNHQNCPMPASSCAGPRWSDGFTCPPNIQPSSLLLTSLKVHCSACSLIWSSEP